MLGGDFLDSEELKRRFVKLRPRYEEFIKEVERILVEGLQKHNVKIHVVESRVKSFESFHNKVVRSQTKEDPFRAIGDIAGIRIICLYQGDLEKIGRIIAEEFNILHFDSSQGSSREDFGYTADHYVISLPAKHEIAHYSVIRDLQCEIQVRTILMHTWNSISQHLDYKGEEEMPPRLRRDFNMLAGLLDLADMNFADLQPKLDRFRNAQKMLLRASSTYYPTRNFTELSEGAKVPRQPTSVRFVERLNKCPSGKEAWRDYEKLVKEILTHLFVPPLVEATEPSRTETGLHVRDMIFDIPFVLSGFWGYVRDKFDSSAIVVECKNYSSPIKGNTVVIPSKYLSKDKLGRFGIVISRMNPSSSAIKETTRLWIHEKKLILNLKDDHLVKMIELKESGKEPTILLDKIIHDFWRSLE